VYSNYSSFQNISVNL